MEEIGLHNGPWSLLETIDEMVYVTDMDSDVLLYMNRHLRETLGIEGHDGYQGKKCYQLLQGIDQRCSFCTNDQLSCDGFYSWTYKNPIMNKRFLLKDTMLLWQGRRCRMELAVDIDSDVTKNVKLYSIRAESILNECLKRVAQTAVASDALQDLLDYMGETLCCERTYIFELSDDLAVMNNTYEWCAPGVVPQMEILQNESTSSIDWWLQSFQEGQLVRIDNLEDLRQTEPLTYAILKPQDIQSLLVGPIYDENHRLVGFVGADNPDPNMISLIAPLLQTISYFIANLFQRRDLMMRLEKLSYRDALTGCLNRNALSEYYSKPMAYSSVGVLYCDVSGLKRVNDTVGHEAGDKLILDSCTRIRDSVPEAELYRIGGDEFLGLCCDIPEEIFRQRVAQLRGDIAAETFHVAVGGVWSSRQPIQLESLMALADQDMYADKQYYYQKNTHLQVRSRDVADHTQSLGVPVGGLSGYLERNGCDISALFRAVERSRKHEYVFIGDMRTHRYYISDAMRDTFGFPDNCVTELATQWVSRIATAEDVKLYQQGMAQLLHQKGNYQDLRYRVRTKAGQIFWIESRVVVTWSPQGDLEFLSGVFRKQDALARQDTITGFQLEGEAALMLESLDEVTQLLVFALNDYESINEQWGRHSANLLLQQIAYQLVQQFGQRYRFYRLEGVHFLAVPRKGAVLSVEDTVVEIAALIEQSYLEAEIHARRPAVFGVMSYPNGVDTPASLLEEANCLTTLARRHPSQAYMVYSPTNPSRLEEVSLLEQQLYRAVRGGMEGFTAVFSPVLSPETGVLKGGQMLLRWKNGGACWEEGELLPMLEDPELLEAVSSWALEEAIRCIRRLVAHRDDFAVMMSGIGAVQDPLGFLSRVEACLNKYHVSGEHLVIVVNQSDFRGDVPQLQWFAEECGGLRIRLALVEFSPEFTGWGGLAAHPAQLLSPHRSALQQADNSTVALALLKSLVCLGHSTSKLVWLQGVENEYQLKQALEAGVDLVQGPYCGDLLECEELIRRINGEQ